MREKNFFWWMFERTMSGRTATFQERSTWEKALLNATSSSKCRIPAQNSFCTAAAASAPRWPRTIFRRWDTRTLNPWTAAGKAGYPPDCPRPRVANDLGRLLSLKNWLGREDSNLHHPH